MKTYRGGLAMGWIMKWYWSPKGLPHPGADKEDDQWTNNDANHSLL